MTLTQAFLLLTVIIWVIYDVVIGLRQGAMQTISVVVWQLCQKYPIIAFGIGLLIGHILAPMIGLNCEK